MATVSNNLSMMLSEDVLYLFGPQLSPGLLYMEWLQGAQEEKKS